MLENLKESTSIQYDATFKVVPRIFFQLFMIFENIDRHALPALHILMTNKSDYTTLGYYQFDSYYQHLIQPLQLGILN